MNAWCFALLGGVLIGRSATALLLFNGRVAGISGIVNGLSRSTNRADRAWRAAFTAGLAGSGGATTYLLGQGVGSPAPAPSLALADFWMSSASSIRPWCSFWPAPSARLSSRVRW